MHGPYISLTFDDALNEHLDGAVPLLAESGLLGTFYVHLCAPALSARRDEWAEAARQGHELGNHTIFHPATESKPWVRQANALESYTLDRMRMELEVANQWLATMDGQSDRTFAYPCSNSFLGRPGYVNRTLKRLGLQNTRFPGLVEGTLLDVGSNKVNYHSIMPEFFIAARGGGIHLHETPPPIDRLDRYSLISAAVEHHSFAEMQQYVERGLEAGSWPILQFHGIGGGHHMDCKVAVFRDFVHWLSERHFDRVVTVKDGANKLWGRAPAASKSIVNV